MKIVPVFEIQQRQTACTSVTAKHEQKLVKSSIFYTCKYSCEHLAPISASNPIELQFECFVQWVNLPDILFVSQTMEIKMFLS